MAIVDGLIGLMAVILLSSCHGDQHRTPQVINLDTLSGDVRNVVNPAEGTWAQSGTEPWRLVEDLRIGSVEGDSTYVFGHVTGVFPDSRGFIWVVDAYAFEIRVFDQNGRFVRTIGGPGDGPGEFGSLPCAFPGPEDEVWVEAKGRWQWFDTAGTLLGGQRTTRTIGCGIQGWTSDGRFLAVNGPYYLVHDRDRSGKVVPTGRISPPSIPDYQPVHWENAEGRRVITLHMPLTHRPMRILGPRGHFWATQGDGEYRITKHGFTGEPTVIFERPYDPIPVPESVRDSAIASLQIRGYRLERGSDVQRVPHVFPPFDLFWAGTDGSLWVRRRLEGGRDGLDVFSPDGRFLGPVSVPSVLPRMTIWFVTSQYLYVSVTDQLDIPFVVRLAIEKPEESG